LREISQGGHVSGIASSKSPCRWFYCIGRKREFILKFKEVKGFFLMQILAKKTMQMAVQLFF
jgi:hypothetical protein